MTGLLIQRAELKSGVLRDVRVAEGKIAAIGEQLAAVPGETTIDARGGALLRGLHDHHLHLFALAAAHASVACGPPEVVEASSLAGSLAAAAERGGWIRGVGYHESVAGDLDARALDALYPTDTPIRIQHRSGALWILNSAALKSLEFDRTPEPKGVERDATGKLTGRIYYEDAWLREKLAGTVIPDLARVGELLASYGVTGVTDATPDKGAPEFAALSDAVACGALRQRVVAMGRADAEIGEGASIEVGAVKHMLREPSLPEFDSLVADIRMAHQAQRAVAFHCVTRAELVLAAAALREAGPQRGDRIEHASIAPPELVELLAELGVWVVTQPGFIYERGDDYARDVPLNDQTWLYRGRGFLAAGVALGAGTDAPYGDADPWLAIRAAVHRTTRGGKVMGEDERLTPERALALFTSAADAPGDVPSELAAGSPADLCLVALPWQKFRERLTSELVELTVCRGEVTWQRSDAR